MIFGCAGNAFDDQPVDAPHECRRIIEFSAFRQHRLVEEHMSQLRERRLVGSVLEALHQRMLRIHLENGQGGKGIVLSCLLEDATHAQAHAELARDQHGRGVGETR